MFKDANVVCKGCHTTNTCGYNEMHARTHKNVSPKWDLEVSADSDEAEVKAWKRSGMRYDITERGHRKDTMGVETDYIGLGGVGFLRRLLD